MLLILFGTPVYAFDLNPYCVFSLNKPLFSLAESQKAVGPVMTVGACQQVPVQRTKAGWWVVALSPNSTFSYRWVGESSHGVTVLHTRYFGGGTGRFDALVFLRVLRKPLRVALLRYIPGGDRATGSFVAPRIEGNRVVVRQLSDRNPPAGPPDYYPARLRRFLIIAH